MQDTGSNRLETADSVEELEDRIPEERRGPTFEIGEVIKIKGYYYRVSGLGPELLAFTPHGRSKGGHNEDVRRLREQIENLTP